MVRHTCPVRSSPDPFAVAGHITSTANAPSSRLALSATRRWRCMSAPATWRVWARASCTWPHATRCKPDTKTRIGRSIISWCASSAHTSHLHLSKRNFDTLYHHTYTLLSANLLSTRYSIYYGRRMSLVASGHGRGRSHGPHISHSCSALPREHRLPQPRGQHYSQSSCIAEISQHRIRTGLAAKNGRRRPGGQE